MKINKEQILQWIDTGCLIAFIAVLALVLILFLRGLLRGWKAGTYHFVALAALFVIPLFFLGPIANMVGEINLGQWITNEIVIESKEATVKVPVTTLFETVYKLVYGILHDIIKLNASASTIANYSIALAGSLVRLLVVMVWAIVCWIVGELLITLLWHIAFKHFIRKEKRKPKLRIISGLEEAVAFMGILIVGISPLSGIISAVKNNGELPDSDNETVMMVKEVIDTYDKSIFNQAFFAWTKGSGADTLDTQIAQFFAQNSYVADSTTYNANLVKEIRIFAGVEGSVVNTLFSEEPTKALASSIIHTSLLIGQTLYSLAEGENALLNELVPLAYDVADNADFLQEEFGGDVTALSDFSATKKARMKAFDAVASSDYVNTIESMDEDVHYVPAYDGLSSFSKATLDRIEDKIEADAETRSYVNAILSGYVYEDYLHNDDSIYEEVLPINAKGELDEERFGEIDWFGEAKILRTCSEQVTALPQNAHADGSSSLNSEEQMMADFLARAAANMDKLIEILIGPRDDSGTPITNENGESKNGVCLLDSDLLSAVMPGVLQYAAYYLKDNVLTDQADPSDFLDKTSAIVETLVGDASKPAEAKINFKQEFGYILDVVGDVTGSEAGKAFIADYKNHPGIEFAKDGTLIEISPGIAQAFMDGIANLDRSKILTYMTPVLGDHYVRPVLASDGALGKLGITKLDFNCENLGQNLSNLLSVGVYCNDIIATFGGLFKQNAQSFSPSALIDAMSSLETASKNYQITHLFDIFTDSPILNPEYTVDGKTVTNYNLASLLQNLLSNMEGASDIKITYETLNGLDLAGTWDGSTLKEKGDNYYTVQVFKRIAETGLIDQISSLSSVSTEAIQAIASAGIDDIFADIGLSQTLRKVLPPFLDKFLLGALLNSDKALDLTTMGITYENLDSAEKWAAEGEAMQAILNLAANGIDLANLDLFNTAIVDLMGNLADSQIFCLPDGTYAFGTFFVDKMLVSITDVSQFKLFTDYPDKTVAAFDNKTVSAVLAEKGDSYWSNKNAEVLAAKKALCSTFVSAMAIPQGAEGWDAELQKLRETVISLNAVGGLDALSNFNEKSLPSLVLALENLTSMDTLGSVLPANVFHKAIESGNVSDMINVDDANLGWFYRNAEEFVAAMEANNYDHSAEAVKKVLDARKVEFDYMISMVKIAATNESIRTGELNFATLDVDALLRPLFYAAYSSKILNPTSVDDLYSSELSMPELTVFENLMVTFVQKSGVYSYVDADGNDLPGYEATAYVKGTKKTVKSIVKSISANDGWGEETVALCNLIDTLQESSFLKDGQISFDVFSTKEGLQDFFASDGAKEELTDLICALEESEMLYRCLPAKLETALNDAVSTVSFGHLPKDIACADFYLYTDSTKADFPRYSYEGAYNTVDGLVDIFASLAACADLDMSDFSTVNATELGNLLQTMATSPIFNTDTTKSVTQFATEATERQGLTAYQAVLCDVLTVDALADYLYYESSPKDKVHVTAGDYDDTGSKTAYLVKSLLPAYDGTNLTEVVDAADLYIGEELVGSLSILKEDRYSSFLGGSDVGKFDALDEDTFCTLLNALNDCTLLRDCVPNAAHKTLVTGSVISVDGISLGSADVFFSYYYYDSDGNFSSTRQAQPNFDMPFYAPEIDQIAMIYSMLKENKDIMSDMKMYDLDAVLARNILLDLHDSYIFHEAGKENRDTTSPLVLDGTKIVNFPSMTVFEQFIYKIMYMTNLCTANYSAAKYYEYGFAEDMDYILANPGTYTYVSNTTGAYYKAYDDITGITNAGDNWLDEISAITTDGMPHGGVLAGDPVVGIVNAAQVAGIFSESSSSVGIDYDTVNKVAPDKIRGLMYAINDSTILDDAMSISMDSLLGTNSGSTGIGLDKYTEHGFTSTLGGDALTTTTLDMNKVSSIFDDGDSSKTYHPVTSIVVATDADISGSFTATCEIAPGVILDMTDSVQVAYGLGYTSLTGPEGGAFYLPLTFTLSGHTFTGDATLYVDYADYDIGAEAYANGGIDAIGYVLSSAYRGEPYSDHYFSFKDYANLTAFFDEYEEGNSDFDHSTYGLLTLFGDSGFYDAGLDATGAFTSSDTPHHHAAAYALHHALTFNISAPMAKIEIEYDSVKYELPNSASISLGDLIGEGSTTADHLLALEGYLSDMLLTNLDYITQEAYWFDHYAGSAGTYLVFEEAMNYVVTTLRTGYGDTIAYGVAAGLDKVFAQADVNPFPEIQKAMQSTIYDYTLDIPLSATELEPHSATGAQPDIGRSIIANLVLDTAGHRGTILDLDVEAPIATGLTDKAKKSTRIDSTTFSDDLFASSFAKMTPAYLNEAAAMFGIMDLLYVDSAFTTEQKAQIKTYFTTVNAEVASQFDRMFYLAGLYDPMYFLAGYTANAVYMPLPTVTDFNSVVTGANGMIAGVATPFSFENVASLYA